MTITREDLIDAIAADLNIVDGMSTTNAAIAAIRAIEALGFVIVPREWTVEMQRDFNSVGARLIICTSSGSVEASWDVQGGWNLAIAGSPLYRKVKG